MLHSSQAWKELMASSPICTYLFSQNSVEIPIFVISSQIQVILADEFRSFWGQVKWTKWPNAILLRNPAKKESQGIITTYPLYSLPFLGLILALPTAYIKRERRRKESEIVWEVLYKSIESHWIAVPPQQWGTLIWCSEKPVGSREDLDPESAAYHMHAVLYGQIISQLAHLDIPIGQVISQ